MSILTVDLGTSNTVAVLSAHGRLRVVDVDGAAVLPSAVFAADDGRLVVGREAERLARLDPARFEPNPKRRVDEGTLLLGNRVVPVVEAFAAVLGKVAGEVSRQLGGARPDEVRLTHPAQWGPVRRNVLLTAARQAGLGTRLVLVPEPVAAAAHFASFPGRSSTGALAVYDLGAGTFDVAVVAGSVVLAEGGLPDLGGLDVDQALLAHVGRQVSHRDPGGWQRLLMPVSTADRRAARAPPAHVGAQPAKRKRWLILVPVALVVVVAASFGISWIIERASSGGDSGPTIKNPLEVADTVDCARVIPLHEVNSIVDSKAEIEEVGDSSDDSNTDLCWWFDAALDTERPDASPFAVWLDKWDRQWLPRGPGNRNGEFVLSGNSAEWAQHGDQCAASVAIGRDTELELKMDYVGDDRCSAARRLLGIAFDNLSSA